MCTMALSTWRPASIPEKVVPMACSASQAACRCLRMFATIPIPTAAVRISAASRISVSGGRGASAARSATLALSGLRQGKRSSCQTHWSSVPSNTDLCRTSKQSAPGGATDEMVGMVKLSISVRWEAVARSQFHSLSFGSHSQIHRPALVRSVRRFTQRSMKKQWRTGPVVTKGGKSSERSMFKTWQVTRSIAPRHAACSVEPLSSDMFSSVTVYETSMAAIATPGKMSALQVHIGRGRRRGGGRGKERTPATTAMVQDGDLTSVSADAEVEVEPNIPCEVCNGRGWLVCDFCDGKKTNVQARTNRIYRRCPNCRAAGVMICPRCKVFKCVSFQDESDDGSGES